MIVNRFDYNPNDGVGQSKSLLDHGNESTVEAQLTWQTISNIDAPIIFDIGANIGTYSTWLARAFPYGKIYCFEPQRLIFQMLCGNLAINNIENCYAYNIALGKNSTIFNLNEPNYNETNSFGQFSLKYDNQTYHKTTPTQMMTLDEFVMQYSIDKIDFIKIDAEGMDIDVLKGGQQTINKFKPSLLVEYTNGVETFLDQIAHYLPNYKLVPDESRNVLAVYSDKY